MTVVEFFLYLLVRDASHDLGLELVNICEMRTRPSHTVADANLVPAA